MDHRHAANIVRLGHRAAAPGAAAIGAMDPTMNIAIPSRLVEPRADTTQSAAPTGACGVNPCEKGVSDSSFKLPIILGIA